MKYQMKDIARLVGCKVSQAQYWIRLGAITEVSPIPNLIDLINEFFTFYPPKSCSDHEDAEKV